MFAEAAGRYIRIDPAVDAPIIFGVNCTLKPASFISI